jgi:hypothetical protein
VKKIIPLVIAFTGILHFAGTAQEKKTPAVVKGVVQDAATREPIANVHVYIVKGEEESMTDNRGAFSIRSWQTYPVRLQAAAKGYASKEVQVTGDRQQVVILLSKTGRN